jgi:hypothetical protein
MIIVYTAILVLKKIFGNLFTKIPTVHDNKNVSSVANTKYNLYTHYNFRASNYYGKELITYLERANTLLL